VNCKYTKKDAIKKSKEKSDNKKDDSRKIRYNVNDLPLLQNVLNELGLGHFLNNFVKLRVTETQHLMKLGNKFYIPCNELQYR
jgi:hypothetical protein